MNAGDRQITMMRSLGYFLPHGAKFSLPLVPDETIVRVTGIAPDSYSQAVLIDFPV